MTFFSRPEPPLQKGALVQLVKDIVGVVLPNVVLFQYNPEKLSHTITPWNPQEVDQTQRGAQMPLVQPFNPQESFSLSLELDATDELEAGNPIAYASGVAPRLAALKKLTYPSEGMFGDLIRNAKALAGGAACDVARPTVPVVLFVWGPGRMLPVRVSSFGVEETLYSPMLKPLHATVSLGLEVMTPDSFKCKADLPQKIATAAYSYTRLLDDALAIVAAKQTSSRATGLPPFM
jgi:hypothetical protein